MDLITAERIDSTLAVARQNAYTAADREKPIERRIALLENFVYLVGLVLEEAKNQLEELKKGQPGS
jgi:hypothetical protein